MTSGAIHNSRDLLQRPARGSRLCRLHAGGGRIRTSVPYTDSIFRHRPGHGDGKPARQPEPVLTIGKRRFSVRRARLAPAMISTPGHRSSIYVTSRSFGTHYTLGSDTTIENAAHWRPERFRIRSSRGGRPYRGGPRVRIHLPPAASRVRTRFQDHGWRRRARIQRGCAGFQLDRVGAVRVARFVCSDSSAKSASGGASGSNAPTLSCCSEGAAGCAQRVSAPMGAMVYCRRNTAAARSPRSGGPLFPRNPKASPSSFPCAWAFGDRRWRGRRQVAIGPPGLFGLVRRDDLGA
jgi:hypothetical protein